MKRTVLLLAFLAFGMYSSSAQIEKKHFDEQVKLPVKYDYLLYTPDSYKTSEKDFPLMVFLHGAGERGTDLEKVKVHGPFEYMSKGNDINAVILAPQCPKGTYWQPHEVAALVKSIIKKYRIDKDRVYLTGLSMGGYGVWATGGEYPELFAAMAPVCGAIYRPIYRNAFHIKDMPIWVFHGALDDVVLPENSNNMVNALLKAGNEQVKYTVYPFANHNAWTKTYNNPELYKWMLSKSK